MSLYKDDFNTPVLNFCLGCFVDQTEKFMMESNFILFWPTMGSRKSLIHQKIATRISVLMLSKRPGHTEKIVYLRLNHDSN